MQFHLLTLGCAKNTADSRRLDHALRAAGHVPSDSPEDSSLLLVNTCGFIGSARAESLDAIRELNAQRHADQQLYVLGCLTERAADEVREAVPTVDGIFGTEQWDSIAASVGPARAHFDLPVAESAPGSASAYLKISDGCDRPCTFCTIPSIKGRMHSEQRERVLTEARELADAGARELVLVAQDLTAYGEDLGERDQLAGLLEDLSGAVPDVPWIRLMYAYPGRVTPALADAMARLPNVVPYLDMPLQHGSDSVLRRMKRPSMNVTRRSIETVRAAVPDVVLRTTFIVGFPGETEREFVELLDFMREQRFDRVGAFAYSLEPGTPAAELDGQLPEELKHERFAAVMELAQELSLEANQTMVGRELDVLVESLEPTTSQTGEPIVIGRTYRDAPEVDGLAFVKGEAPAGDFVRARVVGALPYDLLCDPAGS
jgi:ribosomal protein S12 methylthiotransferase